MQSEELRHWPADNDTTVEMEDYPVLSTIALTLAKILMFILGELGLLCSSGYAIGANLGL